MNVGLTGGIGCGKSSALQLFKEAGAAVLETDQVAKDLLEQHAGVRARLLEEFGPDLFTAEGKVDRAWLASMVFNNSDKLRALESIIHPEVRAVWLQELAQQHTLLVVEIPLLLEKSLQHHFDAIVCVACSDSISERRLQNRGLSKEQIQLRKRNQLPLAHKIEAADHVLLNDGTIASLKQQIEYCIRLWSPVYHFPTTFHHGSTTL